LPGWPGESFGKRSKKTEKKGKRKGKKKGQQQQTHQLLGLFQIILNGKKKLQKAGDRGKRKRREKKG